MPSAIIPVILAGGSGTRLWPLSRKKFPKQFLPLLGESSLVQETVKRFQEKENLLPPILICNNDHRFILAEQMRKIHADNATIILEPIGRNTAPAIAIAALHARSMQLDGNLLVLPADHYLGDIDAFHSLLNKGAELCELGNLVTFGIDPSYPETGYGYIRKGDPYHDVYKIDEFLEKPDIDVATKYFNSGKYLWNSGIFMLNPEVYMQELQAHCPEIADCCTASYENGSYDMDFFRLERKSFERSPDVSIDFAVLQKTTKGVMIPLRCKWNDVGSWDAIWSVSEKDENQNVAIGDVLTSDVERSYLHSTSRLLAVVGLKDHVVVETSDAVLVAPKNQVQNVKVLVESLKAQGRSEAIIHKKVYRPWGAYETINIEKRFQVKRITVNPGAKLSLQKHFHRAEHWVVVKGTAIVTCGDTKSVLKEDESTYIPLGFVHRLENPGKIPLELIEVQSGSYLGEDDIVRMEDEYGRNEEEPLRKE